MRATAAVLYELHKPVIVEDVEVLEPGPHEVLVRWAANGVCRAARSPSERLSASASRAPAPAAS